MSLDLVVVDKNKRPFVDLMQGKMKILFSSSPKNFNGLFSCLDREKSRSKGEK